MRSASAHCAMRRYTSDAMELAVTPKWQRNAAAVSAVRPSTGCLSSGTQASTARAVFSSGTTPSASMKFEKVVKHVLRNASDSTFSRSVAESCESTPLSSKRDAGGFATSILTDRLSIGDRKSVV